MSRPESREVDPASRPGGRTDGTPSSRLRGVDSTRGPKNIYCISSSFSWCGYRYSRRVVHSSLYYWCLYYRGLSRRVNNIITLLPEVGPGSRGQSPVRTVSSEKDPVSTTRPGPSLRSSRVSAPGSDMGGRYSWWVGRRTRPRCPRPRLVCGRNRP